MTRRKWILLFAALHIIICGALGSFFAWQTGKVIYLPLFAVFYALGVLSSSQWKQFRQR